MLRLLRYAKAAGWICWLVGEEQATIVAGEGINLGDPVVFARRETPSEHLAVALAVRSVVRMVKSLCSTTYRVARNLEHERT